MRPYRTLSTPRGTFVVTLTIGGKYRRVPKPRPLPTVAANDDRWPMAARLYAATVVALFTWGALVTLWLARG